MLDSYNPRDYSLNVSSSTSTVISYQFPLMASRANINSRLLNNSVQGYNNSLFEDPNILSNMEDGRLNLRHEPNIYHTPQRSERHVVSPTTQDVQTSERPAVIPTTQGEQTSERPAVIPTTQDVQTSERPAVIPTTQGEQTIHTLRTADDRVVTNSGYLRTFKNWIVSMLLFFGALTEQSYHRAGFIATILEAIIAFVFVYTHCTITATFPYIGPPINWLSSPTIFFIISMYIYVLHNSIIWWRVEVPALWNALLALGTAQLTVTYPFMVLQYLHTKCATMYSIEYTGWSTIIAIHIVVIVWFIWVYRFKYP